MIGVQEEEGILITGVIEEMDAMKEMTVINQETITAGQVEI